MKISVPLINGMLADEYGKYAPDNLMLAGHPIKSFPIEINEAPAETKAFAIVFIDYDSTPVCGFCLLYTSPSPRDGATSRMPSSA